MDKILFKVGKEQSYIRFGDLVSLVRACYFRGIELGYTDNNIYLEWPKMVRFKTAQHFKFHLNIPDNVDYTKCPKDTILPIKFIEKANLSDYDKILYLDEESSLYENSRPMFYKKEGDNEVYRHFSVFWSYANKYYLDTGKRPVLNLPKDNIEPYILIHDRRCILGNKRNQDPLVTLKIIRFFKTNFKKYKIYRCGENLDDSDMQMEKYGKDMENYLKSYDRLIYTKIEKYTDKYIDGYDFGESVYYMNNCSLFIGTNSGPFELAVFLGKPIWHHNNPKIFFGSVMEEGDLYSEFNWKNNMNGVYGKTMFEWLDKEKLFVHNKGQEIESVKFSNYLNRWLK